MLSKGYWVECVPVNANFEQDTEQPAYTASVESFPEICAQASSPDKAIEKLRAKLKSLKEEYKKNGQSLPALDNPVEPSNRLRRVRGWISVYMEVEDPETDVKEA